MKKRKVGVLGATGMVGQRFIESLVGHPWFDLTLLAASSRSAGKKYIDAAKWYLNSEIPAEVSEQKVDLLNPKEIDDVDIVFSALPANIAKGVEDKLAEKGIVVASNASAYRMYEDIPLVIPEVNSSHLDLIDIQKKNRNWSGYIVTNPNCSTIGMVLSLKPLHDKLKLKDVKVVTLQAVSGAGYSGVSSMAIIDNVIPYISSEEEKMESETLKLFGKLEDGKIKNAEMSVSALCNRIAVIDGHLESVFAKTEKNFDLEEVKKIFSEFKSEPQKLKLPTAPKNPIYVKEEIDRPQPRFDRYIEGGMAVSVGRLNKLKQNNEMKYAVLSHNTVRGAAGASILNAEMLCAKNLV